MRAKFRNMILFVVCLFLVSSLNGWAEEAEDMVFNIGEVVVKGEGETITRVTTVDTVDSERIDLTNTRNISDALDTLPGVYVSVGSRNESYINVRGFNQRYVPVFYDGIPLYLPYDGYVDTGNLTTDNVSKIDISKGISSSLYGFNTMGGVINIVSQKPKEEFEGSYRVEWKEGNNGMNTSINMGSNMGKFYFTLGGGFLESDGFEMSGDFEPNALEDGETRDNSDVNDENFAAKFGITPAEGHEYAVGFTYVTREKGLPPTTDPAGRARYWRFTDWDKKTLYFIGDTRLTDDFSLKTRLYRDEYYNVLDSYDNATYSTQTRRFAFHSTYDDQSTGGSLVLRSTIIPKHTISASFHYKEDSHSEQDDSGAVWENYEQKMISYGLEDDIKINDWISLVIGASYDEQKAEYADGGALRDDEGSLNPQAGINFRVCNDADLHFSVGRKTRFPTMSELYSSQMGGNLPNPDLAEEQAINYEVGIEKPIPGDNVVGLNFFYSDVDDLIVEKKNVTPGVDQHQNIGKSRFMGAEFQVNSMMIPNNNIELHYTYLDAENRSADRTSDHLEENSDHKIYLSDLYKLNDWISLFGKVEYNSERHYEDRNTNQWETLKGFWLVDAKFIFDFHKSFNAEIGASNIFDKNYELSRGYPREGRSFFLTLRGEF